MGISWGVTPYFLICLKNLHHEVFEEGKLMCPKTLNWIQHEDTRALAPELRAVGSRAGPSSRAVGLSQVHVDVGLWQLNAVCDLGLGKWKHLNIDYNK